MAIHSSGQTVFSFPHIEVITLGVGKQVDEVAGRASGVGVDSIIGDRSSVGQATGVINSYLLLN